MFREWNFLLGEIWGLLILAALLGLFAGWLIWGGTREIVNREEEELLRSELAKARIAASAQKNETISPRSGDTTRETPPKTETVDEQIERSDKSTVQHSTAAATSSSKPKGLEAPKDGLPDDLTQIKGVGPKLEKLCNKLGYWHFEQIAAWTDTEVAWVDENLEGFKGRVTRDEWVKQARELAKLE